MSNSDMTGKPRTVRLWQEITLALVLKCIVLIIIWAAFFSASNEQVIGAKEISARIFSPPPKGT